MSTASAATGVLPWLSESLAHALAPIRPHHALLVQGPEGVGQLSFALQLAKAWLCETPRAQRGEHGLACGHCASCHLVDEHTHPDVHWVVPESWRAEIGLPVAGAAGEGGSANSTASSAASTSKLSREIKVDQVRAAIHFSEMTASRGAIKVMLVHPAEALNMVAANALLKTLEEPPGNLRFVLSSGDAQALLPTLRSRCQSVNLPVPPRQAALGWLQTQGVVDPEVVLDACGGQPLQALSLVRSGLEAAAWREFPAWIARGLSAPLQSWPRAVLLDALQRLCHDRLLRTLELPAQFFVHSAQDALRPGSLAALTGTAAWLRAQVRHADHPWSQPLATEALVQGVCQRLNHP